MDGHIDRAVERNSFFLNQKRGTPTEPSMNKNTPVQNIATDDTPVSHFDSPIKPQIQDSALPMELDVKTEIEPNKLTPYDMSYASQKSIRKLETPLRLGTSKASEYRSFVHSRNQDYNTPISIKIKQPKNKFAVSSQSKKIGGLVSNKSKPASPLAPNRSKPLISAASKESKALDAPTSNRTKPINSPVSIKSKDPTYEAYVVESKGPKRIKKKRKRVLG